jgi:hypothetical protein
MYGILQLKEKVVRDRAKLRRAGRAAKEGEKGEPGGGEEAAA